MKNSFRGLSLTALACSTILLGACGNSSAPGDSDPAAPADTTTGAGDGQPVAMPAALWSDTPLAGARDVRDVRESAATGDEVILRGTLQDFGDLATFRLVDDGLVDCSESGDDQCPTPWDYCCEDQEALSQYTVNVEFLEGDLPGDWSLRGAHGLDRLTEVNVAGTLHVDEAGNLRLAASRMSLQ